MCGKARVDHHNEPNEPSGTCKRSKEVSGICKRSKETSLERLHMPHRSFGAFVKNCRFCTCCRGSVFAVNFYYLAAKSVW